MCSSDPARVYLSGSDSIKSTPKVASSVTSSGTTDLVSGVSNTRSAAGGSKYIFRSATAVALPGAVMLPPLMTTRSIASMAAGSNLHSSARLVSGPKQTNVI